MKVTRFILSLACCVAAMAQAPLIPRIAISIASTSPNPPTWNSLAASEESITSSTGMFLLHRLVLDVTTRVYSGYDLMLEPQPDGSTYRAAFRPLSAGTSGLPSPETWTMAPSPDYPPTQLVHLGDKIEVAVLTKPDTGQRAVDSVTFVEKRTVLTPEEVRRRAIEDHVAIPIRNSAGTPVGVIRIGQPPYIPKIDGPARDFTGDAADLRIAQPSVHLNAFVSNSVLGVTSPLPWFYVPAHGRYILSLLPRRDLGFTQAGEVRGNRLTITIDGDTITLDCSNLIVPGDSAYDLYVLRDREWQPTASDQRNRFIIGSVDASEIPAQPR